MRNRALIFGGLIIALALVLMGCSLGPIGAARITATPTKTSRPLFTATLTPTASTVPTQTPLPTDTPVPATDTPAPTATPLPIDTPLPTATALPPTDAPPPTDTAVPPTETPAPPTNTPKPAATSTPAPPTNTPKPKVDFKVNEIVAFEDGSLTATGYHNIYFTVIDASGSPLDNILLDDENGQAHFQPATGSKGPGKAEFEMLYAVYNFKIVGDTSGKTFTSETTHPLTVLQGQGVWDDLIRGGICTDVPSCQALGQIHYSYNVTFQRTW